MKKIFEAYCKAQAQRNEETLRRYLKPSESVSVMALVEKYRNAC